MKVRQAQPSLDGNRSGQKDEQGSRQPIFSGKENNLAKRSATARSPVTDTQPAAAASASAMPP